MHTKLTKAMMVVDKDTPVGTIVRVVKPGGGHNYQIGTEYRLVQHIKNDPTIYAALSTLNSVSNSAVGNYIPYVCMEIVFQTRAAEREFFKKKAEELAAQLTDVQAHVESCEKYESDAEAMAAKLVEMAKLPDVDIKAITKLISSLT